MAWNPFAKEKQLSPKIEIPPASAPTRFAFNLFPRVLSEKPRENVFLSPASIHFVLELTFNGATGETQDEMVRALELQGLSIEDVNQGAKVLKTLLERREPTVELALANSLWARTGIAFRPEFLKTARECFSADAREIDFSKAEAADTINAWCSEHTRGKINSIVSHSEVRSAILALVNALYFKGAWAEGVEFSKAATQDREFALLDGSKKSVPVMSKHHDFKYFEDNSVQFVRVPYGDDNIAMYVLLPKPGIVFEKFCSSLSAQQWETYVASQRVTPGNLQLPRFKIEFEIELGNCLAALGMPRAFSNSAQFSPMSTATIPLKIGMVKHKTFVDVNEAGTEAAAVTAVLMRAGCAAPQKPPKPFTMIVNRPFVVAIRDDRTGTLLFLGAIVEP